MTSGTVLALGEPALLAGYALAGAVVVAAEGPVEVRRAWDAVGDDVALVLLSPTAAEALAERRDAPGGPLSVVIPR